MDIYIVQEGDTVDSIAAVYGITADSIIFNNQIPPPYPLTVGQALLLSTGMYQGERPPIISNGYAYPFISQYNLEQSLPYLTELSVFSYGFTEEGYLIPPPIDDTPMIAAAYQFQTRPILSLTPFDNEEGRFNNHLISVVVSDSAVQSVLISQLLELLPKKGYTGVDVDFEYILEADKTAYVDFIRNLRTVMNEAGYTVSVALAPKISDEESGPLVEGFDYALLGEAADSLLLMTYEWGYAYGEPMAVAPLDKVRQVVEYAVSRIPAEKLSLGIPNYAYDWALPYEPGVTKARTLGNIEAIQLAIAYGSVIHFDETAQTPFFNYREYNVDHVVWFEDVRSLEAKFDLAKEFNLRGIGYWQIMQLFRANWLLLADRFTIRKD